MIIPFHFPLVSSTEISTFLGLTLAASYNGMTVHQHRPMIVRHITQALEQLASSKTSCCDKLDPSTKAYCTRGGTGHTVQTAITGVGLGHTPTAGGETKARASLLL